MGAQLLYKMIKSKTEYPLHKAIRVEREDVVFLYLIEMDSQVLSWFCPNRTCLCFSKMSLAPPGRHWRGLPRTCVCAA